MALFNKKIVLVRVTDYDRMNTNYPSTNLHFAANVVCLMSLCYCISSHLKSIALRTALHLIN